MDGKNNGMYIGKAGEYRVYSELLLKEYNPAFRAIDDGVDIVLENGITLQIKTISKVNHRERGYMVGLTTARYRKGKPTERISKLTADFLITWLIDIDEFYIIPEEVVRGKSSICLNLEKSTYNNYKNNWKILRRGVK